MKRFFILALLLPVLLAGCKKDQLTPDGKPKSDAQKNILRIEANAGASYYVSVFEIDPKSISQSINDATYYLLKENLTSAYECTFTATPGNVLYVEVSTSGPSVSCEIYYKGMKVTKDASNDTFNSNSALAPSHANLTYQIPD